MKRFCLLLSSAAVAVLSGCGLIYDYDNCPPDSGGDFTMNNDWKYALSARPEGMAFAFFPEGTSGCWRFDFPGKEGGEAKLPDGDYSVLTFNDDTSGVLFDHSDSYSSFTFYSRAGALYDGLGGTIDNPLGPATTPDGEEVHICPDMIWCNAVPSFRLYEQGSAIERSPDGGYLYSDRRSITLYPQPVVALYRFSVMNIEHFESAARICASISGMAALLRPSDMWRGDTGVTLPLRAEKTSDQHIEGRFLTYGLPSGFKPDNILTLYIWLTDGRKMCYEFDVTETVRNAPDPMNVEIIINGLTLPVVEHPQPGGTFDVSVDGWTIITIDITA